MWRFASYLFHALGKYGPQTYTGIGLETNIDCDSLPITTAVTRSMPQFSVIIIWCILASVALRGLTVSNLLVRGIRLAICMTPLLICQSFPVVMNRQPPSSCQPCVLFSWSGWGPYLSCVHLIYKCFSHISQVWSILCEVIAHVSQLLKFLVSVADYLNLSGYVDDKHDKGPKTSENDHASFLPVSHVSCSLGLGHVCSFSSQDISVYLPYLSSIEVSLLVSVAADYLNLNL